MKDFLRGSFWTIIIILFMLLAEWIAPAEAMEYIATAYCPCEKCCGKSSRNRPNGIVYTASGTRAVEGRTIAVDPKVIPLGSTVRVNGKIYIAQDTGRLIKGNRIDVYFDNHKEACKFGRQIVEVEIVHIPRQIITKR